MAKKKGKSLIARHPMRTLGVFVFVMGIIFGFRYSGFYQSVGINEVSAPLTNGDNTLSGILMKDAGAGSVGKYYLALDDGQFVLLDVRDMDTLIGTTVKVSGLLTIPTESGNLPFMIVKELSTN